MPYRKLRILDIIIYVLFIIISYIPLLDLILRTPFYYHYYHSVFKYLFINSFVLGFLLGYFVNIKLREQRKFIYFPLTLFFIYFAIVSPYFIMSYLDLYDITFINKMNILPETKQLLYEDLYSKGILNILIHDFYVLALPLLLLFFFVREIIHLRRER